MDTEDDYEPPALVEYGTIEELTQVDGFRGRSKPAPRHGEPHRPDGAGDPGQGNGGGGGPPEDSGGGAPDDPGQGDEEGRSRGNASDNVPPWAAASP